MTDKPLPEDEKPADQAYEDFQRTVRRLVNTPHKPHVLEPKAKPKRAKKA